MNRRNYHRIMLFGRPGSGKSTFALKLHKITGLPLYHLDRYFFTEGWVERDYQKFLDMQQQLVDQDRWIIDGNCTKSLEMRYQRADLSLYFNFPRWLCYLRILKRLFTKNPAIKDRADRCPETIRWSLLSYMWTFEQRVSDPIKKLHAKYPHVTFIEVKSNGELENIEK